MTLYSNIEVRPAELGDSQELFDWRNDPITRANSFTTDVLDFKEHESWFSRSLARDDRLILIGLRQETKVGMCRFDSSSVGAQTEVSINLDPKLRGQGLAAPLLIASMIFFRGISTNAVVARVKNANCASRRAFERAGFVAGSYNKHETEYFWPEASK